MVPEAMQTRLARHVAHSEKFTPGLLMVAAPNQVTEPIDPDLDDVVEHWLRRAVDQNGMVLEILGAEPARYAGRETLALQADEAAMPDASGHNH